MARTRWLVGQTPHGNEAKASMARRARVLLKLNHYKPLVSDDDDDNALTTLTNLHAPRRLFTRLRTIPTPLTPLALDAHLTPARAATVTLAMRRAKFSIRYRSERPVIVPSQRPPYQTIENIRSDRHRATAHRVRRRFRRFPSPLSIGIIIHTHRLRLYRCC